MDEVEQVKPESSEDGSPISELWGPGIGDLVPPLLEIATGALLGGEEP